MRRGDMRFYQDSSSPCLKRGLFVNRPVPSGGALAETLHRHYHSPIGATGKTAVSLESVWNFPHLISKCHSNAATPDVATTNPENSRVV